MKISLCLLATRKYKQFCQPLLEDVKKYFLLNHEIEVNLFIDEIGEYYGDERVNVVQHLIVSYKFPEITLFRYRIMTSITYNSDYIFYMDVDMSIKATVSEEILGGIVAVRHPGFFRGGGSWETNEKSMCYTHPENRIYYFAGGVQAGSTKEYYRAMEFMRNIIDIDVKNGIMPVWQDESALNFFLTIKKPTVVLNPSYCMVEAQHLRKAWGISDLPEIIVALDKNHNEIRN